MLLRDKYHRGGIHGPGSHSGERAANGDIFASILELVASNDPKILCVYMEWYICYIFYLSNYKFEILFEIFNFSSDFEGCVERYNFL